MRCLVKDATCSGGWVVVEVRNSISRFGIMVCSHHGIDAANGAGPFAEASSPETMFEFVRAKALAEVSPEMRAACLANEARVSN